MRKAQAGFRRGIDSKSAADLLAEVGPTFRVDLGLKSRSAAGEAPDLPAKRVHALIDTGSGINGVDEDLAHNLRLPFMDEGEISGVHGSAPARFYVARLYVPDLDRLLFEPFAGLKLEQGGQPHRVILGRPFLRRYRMLYDAISGEVEVIEP